eukprot:TRINITY_DN16913_c0_g1_i1.p1 TRINITY_DN16913_c0_g1~~TRINITY_DN16913_c0_g1_i1.p1  ORF type:complete len:586 (+),score=147.77 TRINITY_DN16913_c0_g1_i1:150-1760(+)
MIAAPDMMLGMSRSMVVMMQFNEQKQDYVDSLKDLTEGTPEYKAALDACHARGAERCVKVARLHRGLYVKAAQFIASLRGGTGDRGVPRQYTEALSVFTDHAPHKPLAEIAEVLRECAKLGEWPAKPLDASCSFRSIDPEPVASASLAQVHRAELQDGTPVAIKMQYPELRKEMASDFAVFKQMGEQIKMMAGGYDLMWIVEDFERNLKRELDFELEANNAEETARALADLAPSVYVPKVYRELSSKSVLTMEFCTGLAKLTDPEALRKAGLESEACASLLSDTFARMIFFHGRVHADPHAGNIYVRAVKEANPQLVILDHGLYFDLNENDVRINFCKYWKACVVKDRATMASIGQRFAGALRRFLPLVLSPWFIFGGSGVSLHEVLSAAKGELPDTIGIRDVADFVVATREGGANLIGLLHSLGYTRGLLEALQFPERRRVESMLRYAVVGDTPKPPAIPRELTAGERSWVWWRVAMLRFHIGLLAPLARPLAYYAKAETAPPLWLLASGPALVTALAVHRWYQVSVGSRGGFLR